MRFIKYFIVSLLVLYFQILVAPRCAIWGVTPFFLLPYIVFISINLSITESTTITFLTGMAIDLLNPYLLGLSTILLLTVSLLVTKYHTSVTKDKIGPVAISVFMINLIFFVPFTLMKGIILRFDQIRLGFFPLELIYNTIVTLLFLMILVVLQKVRLVIDV